MECIMKQWKLNGEMEIIIIEIKIQIVVYFFMITPCYISIQIWILIINSKFCID